MDVRFITRALEEKYRRVLVRDGAPSGLDYLEKIVQIPYRVRPIQPAAMLGFLESQMEMEGTRTGPDETDGASPTGGEVGSDTASLEGDGGETPSSDESRPRSSSGVRELRRRGDGPNRGCAAEEGRRAHGHGGPGEGSPADDHPEVQRG